MLVFTSCTCVMILSLCVCFSLQLGRTHSPWPLGQGSFKTLVQMKPPQWNLSKYGGALMMEKSDIMCFMIWMWYIRKYSSLPIKYNFKKVEAPSKQAPQSNSLLETYEQKNELNDTPKKQLTKCRIWDRIKDTKIHHNQMQ